MSKETKPYTIIQHGKKLISLDDIDMAREGLEFYGESAYIKYNQPGIDSYEAAKEWERAHDRH